MNSNTSVIPDPPQTPETAAYWEAANEKRLVIRHCSSCGKNHYYPRAICPICFSEDTRWVTSSGRGVIYSFSINRRMDPAAVIAYVTLDENVTMLACIVGCDFDNIAIGDRVQVVFQPSLNGQLVPNFAVQKSG